MSVIVGLGVGQRINRPDQLHGLLPHNQILKHLHRTPSPYTYTFSTYISGLHLHLRPTPTPPTYTFSLSLHPIVRHNPIPITLSHLFVHRLNLSFGFQVINCNGNGLSARADFPHHFLPLRPNQMRLRVHSFAQRDPNFLTDDLIRNSWRSHAFPSSGDNSSFPGLNQISNWSKTNRSLV